MYQLHLKSQDLPLSQQQWLVGPVPKSVAYFRKDPELGFAIFLLPLLCLPFVVFAIHFVLATLNHQPQDRGDVVSGALVTVPIAFFALKHFFSRYRDHQKIKQGTYRHGVFIDQDVVLWCEDFKTCHLFYKNSLKKITIQGVPVYRAGYKPDSFGIVGEDFKLDIPNVTSYDFLELTQALRHWDPKIVTDWDRTLDAYFGKSQPANESHAHKAKQKQKIADEALLKPILPTTLATPNVFVANNQELLPPHAAKDLMFVPQTGLEAERLVFAILTQANLRHVGTYQGVEAGVPYVVYYFSEVCKLNSDEQKRLQMFLRPSEHEGVIEICGHNKRKVAFQYLHDSKFAFGTNNFAKVRPLRAWAKEQETVCAQSNPVEFFEIPKNFAPVHADHFKNLLEASKINYFMDMPMKESTLYAAPEEWVFDKQFRVPLHFLRPILKNLADGTIRGLQKHIDAEDWAHVVEIGESGIYFDDWTEWYLRPQAFV